MPDRLTRKSSNRAAKLLAAACVGMILGIGICSVGGDLASQGHTFAQGFHTAGSYLFLLSALAFIVAAVWLVIAAFTE